MWTILPVLMRSLLLRTVCQRTEDVGLEQGPISSYASVNKPMIIWSSYYKYEQDPCDAQVETMKGEQLSSQSVELLHSSGEHVRGEIQYSTTEG